MTKYEFSKLEQNKSLNTKIMISAIVCFILAMWDIGTFLTILHEDNEFNEIGLVEMLLFIVLGALLYFRKSITAAIILIVLGSVYTLLLFVAVVNGELSLKGLIWCALILFSGILSLGTIEKFNAQYRQIVTGMSVPMQNTTPYVPFTNSQMQNKGINNAVANLQINDLVKLKEMYEQGFLTEEEFNKIKQSLLG